MIPLNSIDPIMLSEPVKDIINISLAVAAIVSAFMAIRTYKAASKEGVARKLELLQLSKADKTELDLKLNKDIFEQHVKEESERIKTMSEQIQFLYENEIKKRR